jgi:hypothetical protein
MPSSRPSLLRAVVPELLSAPEGGYASMFSLSRASIFKAVSHPDCIGYLY